MANDKALQVIKHEIEIQEEALKSLRARFDETDNVPNLQPLIAQAITEATIKLACLRSLQFKITRAGE